MYILLGDDRQWLRWLEGLKTEALRLFGDAIGLVLVGGIGAQDSPEDGLDPRRVGRLQGLDEGVGLGAGHPFGLTFNEQVGGVTHRLRDGWEQVAVIGRAHPLVV